MTKTELIAKIEENFGSKTAAHTAIDAVLKGISDSLQNEGDSFSIPGLGTLKVVRRAARKGRNPRTGETLTIPESLVVRFSPSKVRKSK